MLNLILVALLVFALLRIISAPIQLAIKLLVNAVSGLVALFLVNLLSPVTGLYLGMNLVNALIVGIFGLPGLVLLILAKWVL